MRLFFHSPFYPSIYPPVYPSVYSISAPDSVLIPSLTGPIKSATRPHFYLPASRIFRTAHCSGFLRLYSAVNFTLSAEGQHSPTTLGWQFFSWSLLFLFDFSLFYCFLSSTLPSYLIRSGLARGGRLLLVLPLAASNTLARHQQAPIKCSQT